MNFPTKEIEEWGIQNISRDDLEHEVRRLRALVAEHNRKSSIAQDSENVANVVTLNAERYQWVRESGGIESILFEYKGNTPEQFDTFVDNRRFSGQKS